MSGADEVLVRFGEAVRRFLTRSGKRQHASGMFDLQRRTLIGTYLYFDHLPWALRALGEYTTPESMGRLGRGLCGAPSGAQINGLLWGYLLARENELALGRPGGDPEDLALVVDWWERAMLAHRGDGSLLPHETAGHQPIASPEYVRAVLECTEEPEGGVAAAGEITAALQLYSYVLQGEQRGTVNFHGPYPSGDGTCLLVEEFTRLRHDELPWRARPPLLPTDTVCTILEVEGVTFASDLFQGIESTPVDYRAHASRAALLTCDGGEPRPLRPEERTAIVGVTARERERLFRTMMAWDADFRIVYGLHHYVDFLSVFFEQAGCEAPMLEELRARGELTRQRRLTEIATGEPAVFSLLFDRPDDEPLFTLSDTPVAHA